MKDSAAVSVTVIMLTYHPVLKKALETLNSIVMQKHVDLQVIVADDCSPENHFEEFRAFLEKKQFSDYILLDSSENHGTVKNISRCVEHCRGDYIKMISPGDYLYGEDILYRWASEMKQKGQRISVGDAIYYVRKDDGYSVVREHAYPQAAKLQNGSNERKKMFYQLIYNDYWLGASTLIEKDTFAEYIELVSQFAVYAEDNMYRIAACDGVKRGYFPMPVMMYEFDTGISSQGEKGQKWHKILVAEWVRTNEFIGERLDMDPGFIAKFKKMTAWKKENEDIRSIKLSGKNPFLLFKRLLPAYIAVPGLFFWNVRRVLFTRWTPTDIDESIAQKIFAL